MKRSLWPLRAAIAIAILLYALTFRQWTATYALFALLGLTLLPFTLEIDRIGEIILGLVGLVAAYILTVSIGPAPKHPISEGFALVRAFACFWSLAYACLRVRFRDPFGGHASTLFFPLFVVAACGGDHIGYLYHALVAVFSIVSLLALAALDPSRPALPKATSRRKLLLVVAFFTATLVATGLTLAIPPVHQWITQRVSDSFLNRAQTGFSMYFRVGSLSEMLQSERAVLRVHGRFSDTLRLRGIVYNRYFNKHWSTSRTRSPKVYRLPTRPIASSLTVERIAGERYRYFAPLDIDHLSTPSGHVDMDEMGLLRPLQKEMPERLSFQLTKQRSPALAPPVGADLRLFGGIEKRLQPLALAWTKAQSSSLAKIKALVHKLQSEYRYSLSFKRPPHLEPIVDFLEYNKQGHCEYFASALALLARSIGLPARVIGGYLVYEYNALGGYYIVREKNAHAWAEIWLPNKGWQTFDATPASGLRSHNRDRSTLFGGTIDLLRVWLDKAQEWLLSLTLTQVLTLIFSFIALWIAIRVLRRFRQKARSSGESGPHYRDPLATYQDLLHTLHPTLPKQEHETIEHYARRLRRDEYPPHVHQAAQLLLDYAALRYGTLGSEEELQQRIQQWLQEQHISAHTPP